ncbi:nuclear transport factor 2 family protein [Pseudonocardia sp. NPDC049154]|uniref:nuclear transport factor 2 family protein n=1 Tax=Pseudonocardia sp. NPDC049154 TaxID=3155501 RepID=UPI0033E9987B
MSRELLDRLEILELYSRYALGMDRADRELFVSAWAPDATFVCEALKLDAVGRDAILDWFDRGPGKGTPIPGAGGNVRLAGNHVIELAGDRATGRAELAAFRYTGTVVHPYAIGSYDDVFVRTAEGWRIAHRDMVVNPVVPAP